MPRPLKKRKIFKLPEYKLFGPLEKEVEENDFVFLSIDEYEVIRLIDTEKLNQIDCAECMGIARSTVQRIYEIAREKISMCIVFGRTLKIEGGEILLHDGDIEHDDLTNGHRKRKRYGKQHF